jgi:outer membrane protein insertion porin family
LVGDLVLRTGSEFGFLSAWNKSVGVPPFERFYVGGDGLSNFVLDGRETIGLRGYPNQSLTPQGGGTMYAKYTLELRYPLTLNPGSTIYGLVFAEGGNAYDNLKEFKPFEVKRSLGAGIRIFLPQFGLLGVDFGRGFDNTPGQQLPSGWQTHFTIGQQF